MNPPLEDSFEDIVGKAKRGLGLGDSELAARAGVPVAAVQAALRGECDDAALPAIARALDLDPDSLLAIAHGAWRPDPVPLDGLLSFESDCRGMMVNCYLVFDPETRDAALFDTGADAAPVLAAARSLGLAIRAIGITHTHSDHIAALPDFRRALPGVPVFAGRGEGLDRAQPLDDGDAVGAIGRLTIDARETSGHARCGITYVVRGLAAPVAVVGDALFAGSMGGGMVSWKTALDHNRRRIFTLPPDTVVCPGHGPLTTVATEMLHNPCYPEFKPSQTPS